MLTCNRPTSACHLANLGTINQQPVHWHCLASEIDSARVSARGPCDSPSSRDGTCRNPCTQTSALMLAEAVYVADARARRGTRSGARARPLHRGIHGLRHREHCGPQPLCAAAASAGSSCPGLGGSPRSRCVWHTCYHLLQWRLGCIRDPSIQCPVITEHVCMPGEHPP